MKKCFFTILELLTVIAVIMLLASLLLPALNRSLETSRRIACTGNQKQIYLGWKMYEDDNNYMPIPTTSYWQTILVENGYLASCMIGNSDFDNIEEPVGIFKCPSEKRKIVDPAVNGWNTWKGCHYGININMILNVPTKSIRQWDRLSRIKETSKIAIFADKPPVINSIFWYNTTEFRHNSGWNVVFLDGHSNWLPAGQTPCALNSPDSYKDIFYGDNRFWDN